MKNSFKNKFIFNLGYAFLAQIVSLFVSIIINFLLPKFLGVEDFSFWQLFIFYSQYLPFLAFGLNDGVYLRYGGAKYNELRLSDVKTQLYIGFFYQTFFSFILIVIYSIFAKHDERFLILILSCCYFLLFTVQNYLGYIFQAINEISFFSKATLCQRLIFILLSLLFLLLQFSHFLPFVIAYIIAEFFSTIYSIYKGRDIFKASLLHLRYALFETKNSIVCGIKLMIANIASMLILGIGRQLIDMHWGLITFGKVSLAITLTNFILVFIQQVGMVMFPMLRQVEDSQRRHIYVTCHNILSLILPLIYICYFPGVYVLGLWLPQYQDSLYFLSFILPICCFDAKTQMLCNTYLKVMRKESSLLKINCFSMIISLVLCNFSVFYFNSIIAVLISMSSAILIKNVMLEYYLAKLMSVEFMYNVFFDVFFAVIFIVTSLNGERMLSFVLVAFSYLIILFIKRNFLASFFRGAGL